MQPILQTHLPFAPWMDPRTARLPGVLPLEADDWLRVDEAFAAQMAERDRLLAAAPEKVHALLPRGQAAATELYLCVLSLLVGSACYIVEADRVTRPDGITVMLDAAQPLLTLARLVQEDLCVLEAEGDEHILTGAALCFPAGWTLAQKIGRPLSSIHAPVPSYDDALRRRVQRMFEAIRPDQPLWRGNSLLYDDATLHQPRLESEPRPQPVAKTYARSERQCFVRLPQSRAVVFSIHTYVLRRSDLPPAADAALLALHP